MPNEQSNIILYQTSDGVTMVVAKKRNNHFERY